MENIKLSHLLIPKVSSELSCVTSTQFGPKKFLKMFNFNVVAEFNSDLKWKLKSNTHESTTHLTCKKV